MDFTLHTYQQFLRALQDAGYSFYTFEEWCDAKASGRYIILRHDVDLKPYHSLRIAQLEAEMGIRASYYFRANANPNELKVIQEISKLKHEIGYHYNDLSTFNGNFATSILNFEKQLYHLRQFYPVRTICMHGSPRSKYDNRDLWTKYNYRDFGIVGEPYLDFLIPLAQNNEVIYFTDTARMWDGYKYNVRDRVVGGEENLATHSKSIHSTFDLINWLRNYNGKSPIMITTHPQRWTNNRFEWLFELVFQNIKNVIKHFLMRLR